MSKPFKNREEAAFLLGNTLAPMRGFNPLVLAVPCGGVPMGNILAFELDGELDVILVHKIGAPDNREVAIGAVNDQGHFFPNEYLKVSGVDNNYLNRQIAQEYEALRNRRKLFTHDHEPPDVDGRQVLLVDDGIATGSTLEAALRTFKGRHPKKMVVAAAVASPLAVQKLSTLADEVVTLIQPDDFSCVADYFEEFHQVKEKEVIDLLAAWKQKKMK